MYWSVHQYQKPMIAEPGRMASQGHSGSALERMRWRLLPTAALVASQPPSKLPCPNSRKPKKRMQRDPKISTGDWSTAVYMITRMPPKIV